MTIFMDIQEAQKKVQQFAQNNKWDETPSIDKFDHLHEELIEMSRHLRYKSTEERTAFVSQNQDLFTKEMGDLFFGVCRLANQLGVDLTEGFLATYEKVLHKYTQEGKETNIIRHNEPI